MHAKAHCASRHQVATRSKAMRPLFHMLSEFLGTTVKQGGSLLKRGKRNNYTTFVL